MHLDSRGCSRLLHPPRMSGHKVRRAAHIVAAAGVVSIGQGIADMLCTLHAGHAGHSAACAWPAQDAAQHSTPTTFTPSDTPNTTATRMIMTNREYGKLLFVPSQRCCKYQPSLILRIRLGRRSGSLHLPGSLMGRCSVGASPADAAAWQLPRQLPSS